jgi:hypothetical protein
MHSPITVAAKIMLVALYIELLFVQPVDVSMDGRWRLFLFDCFSRQNAQGKSPLFHLSRLLIDSGVPRIFFGGGVQQIQLTKGRENGDLGAVAPSQGFRPICKWVKPVFLLGSYDVFSTELGIWFGFVKTSE